MACSLEVTIKVNGEDRVSNLYKALNKAVKSRSTANKIYNMTKLQEFKDSELYKNLKFDENGEPTFASLYENGIDELINISEYTDSLERELGAFSGRNRVYINNGINDESLAMMKKAIEFNKNKDNKNFVAVINVANKGKQYTDDPKIYLTVETRDADGDTYANKLEEYYNVATILYDMAKENNCEGLLSHITRNTKLYFKKGSVELINPANLAKTFLSSMNLLLGNRDETIRSAEDIKRLITKSSSLEKYYVNPIVDYVVEMAKKTIPSGSSVSLYDRFKNALDDEENRELKEAYLTESEKNSEDYAEIALWKMMKKRLLDPDYVFSTGNESINRLLANSNYGTILNSIGFSVAKTMHDNKGKLLSYIGVYDENVFKSDYERKAIPESYRTFIENCKNMASEKIDQIDEYFIKLDKLFKNIINLEYRYKKSIENRKRFKEEKSENSSKNTEELRKIINNLNNARKAGNVAMGIYEYIKAIVPRLQQIAQEIRAIDYEKDIKMASRIYREANDFITAYKMLTAGMYELISDGTNYIDELVDSASDEIKSVFSWGFSTKIPDVEEFKELDKILRNSSTDEIMNNINDIKNRIDNYLKYICYETKRAKSSDKEDNDADYARLQKRLDSIVSIFVIANNSSVIDKQTELLKAISVCDASIKIAEGEFNSHATKLFANFLDQYVDKEQRTVKFGSYQGFNAGQEIDINELLQHVGKDINGYQKLFASMADAPDIILNLVDKSIKMARQKARMEFMEDVDAIKAEAQILESAGIKDTDWMFERDEEGNLTGYYVESSFKKSAFDMCMQDKALRKKLGLIRGEVFNPIDATEEQLNIYREAMLANYSILQSQGVVENKQYKDIMADPAKKRFYQFFIKTYERLQSYYPQTVVERNRIIGIKKDLYNQLKDKESIKEKAKGALESFKDSFSYSFDDEYSTMGVDLRGEEIKMLPICYANFSEEDLPNISLDCISNIMKYASKAHQYNTLIDVVDSLEVGREVLKNRRIDLSKNGRPVVESRKRAREQQESGDNVEVLTKVDGGTSNAYKLFDSALDSRLYGRGYELEGSFKLFGIDIDYGKVANLLNKRTAESALSFSLINGVSNATTAVIMEFIESCSSQFFSKKDLLYAEGIYLANMTQYCAECRAKIKTNKLSLFSELFDVQNEYFMDNEDIEWNKNAFVRIYGKGVGNILQNAGEHWVAHLTALAMANTVILEDKDGNKYNLWEAYDVKYFDENRNLVDTDKGYGAKLVMKEGLRKSRKAKNEQNVVYDVPYEELESWSDKDIYDFHQKCNGVNHGMHGIYNSEDGNMIQRYALGRLAYMFRKWIPAAIHKRFSGVQYDMDKKAWHEGYYSTSLRVVKLLASEIKRGNMKLREVYGTLSDEEKENVRRALIEISICLVLSFLCHNFFKDAPDDDDDDDDGNNKKKKKNPENMTLGEKFKSYCYRFLRLLMWRTLSELESMCPNPGMIQEAIRIFKSPMASINTADSIMDIFKAVDPRMWGLFDEEGDNTHIVKSGYLKGHSIGFASLFGNRFLFPRINTIAKNIYNVDVMARTYMNGK